LNVGEYCNVCENFPCLGNHPKGVSLLRYRVVDMPPGEWRFGPFRGRVPDSAEARRLAEEQDRREWIEGIRRRLGLVAEVHRCRVYDDDENTGWAWWCWRPGCAGGGYGYSTQARALAKADAHTRSFMPESPEETAVAELDLLAFDALCGAVLAEQDAFADALPGRMEQVAETINGYLAGVLPEGVRFEWTADGE
jgi:hypothetical protein